MANVAHGWFPRRLPSQSPVPRAGSAAPVVRPLASVVLSPRPVLPRGGVFRTRPPRLTTTPRPLLPTVIRSDGRRQGVVIQSRPPKLPPVTGSRPLRSTVIRSDFRRTGQVIATRPPRKTTPPRMLPATVVRSDSRRPGQVLIGRTPPYVRPNVAGKYLRPTLVKALDWRHRGVQVFARPPGLPSAYNPLPRVVAVRSSFGNTVSITSFFGNVVAIQSSFGNIVTVRSTVAGCYQPINLARGAHTYINGTFNPIPSDLASTTLTFVMKSTDGSFTLTKSVNLNASAGTWQVEILTSDTLGCNLALTYAYEVYRSDSPAGDYDGSHGPVTFTRTAAH